MTPMTVSKSSDPLVIKCLSYNPIQKSRLGDLGYLDGSGHWHVILNIFDQYTCEKAGVATITLTEDVSKYITEKNHEPLNAPVVRLFQGGRFEILSPDQLT